MVIMHLVVNMKNSTKKEVFSIDREEFLKENKEIIGWGVTKWNGNDKKVNSNRVFGTEKKKKKK